MAINFCPNGAAPVFNFDTEKEQNAFNYYVSVSDSISEAYSRFHQHYRTLYRQYLKDRLGTQILDGFTPAQQQQTVDLMRFFFTFYMNNASVQTNGIPDANKLKKYIQNVFEEGGAAYEKNKNVPHKLDMINLVRENFDAFWDMTTTSLKDSGITIDNEGKVSSVAGPDFVRRNWDDEASFKINPKDTSSAKVRLALSFIPETDWKRDRDTGEIITDSDGNRETEVKTNYLGYPAFVSLDETFDTVASVLSNYLPPDNVDNKFKDLLRRLKSEKEFNPQLRQIAHQLENKVQDTAFQSDFINSLHKHYANESMILIQPNRKSGYTLNVIDSNRTSQKETIKQSWYENQKRLPMVSQDVDGDLRIKTTEIEKIKDEYISSMNNHLEDGSLRDERAKAILRNTLEKLGIAIPDPAIDEFFDDPKTISKTGDLGYHIRPNNGGFNKKGLLGIVFNTFLENVKENPTEEQISEYGKLGLNNPIYGQDTQGIIDKIAQLTAKHTPKIYSPSYRNSEGNLIHALQDHTSLSKEFLNLINNPETALDNIDAYERASVIRQRLADEGNPANIRNVLSIEYLDGLKRWGRGKGSPHAQMSTAEKVVMRLSLFQRPQRNDRVKFLAPTLGDKSRDYIVTLPKIQQLYGDKQWLSDTGSISNDGELSLALYGGEVSALYDAVQAEVNRILNQQQLEEDNENFVHPLGEDYQKGSKLFYFFPELNSDNTPEIWSTDGKLKNPTNSDQVEEIMRRKIREKLYDKVNQTKDSWRNLGITSDNMSDWLMDRKYLTTIPYRMAESNKKETYAALDYQLSYRLFHVNVSQIVAGDPAQHVKYREGDVESTISDTLVNLQKRYVNHIAPSIEGNWGTDSGKENVRMITMLDREVGSKELDFYKEILGDQLAEQFFGEDAIESTDAQEYTTVEEHAFMALSHGEISQDTYDKIKNAADKARDNNNPRNQYSLRSALGQDTYDNFIRSIKFLAHKPVYVGKKYYKDLDQSMWMYRKTSSFPLIPEMVKGTGLDNLRIAMENQGVDRAAYVTADKLGGMNPVNIFESEGNKNIIDSQSIEDQMIDAEIDTINGNIQTRSRNNLGLQFQLPRGKAKRVKIGSQLNKLLTQEVKDKTFIIDGEELTGRQVEQRKQELRKKMFKLSRDELFDDLNVDVRENRKGEEVIYFEDNGALQDLLLEEARARDWDASAIDALQLDEQDEFVLPLSFTPNTTAIESLLVSIIDNRIMTQEAYGAGYVQTSGTGWENIANNSGVIVADSYDPEQGLRHIHEKEDGSIGAAQVLIPWNFKDSDGNLLDPKDYTKKVDGRRVIDNDMLDPKIREIIGFRIPTQGQNSALPIEVVGFLPPSIDKLMVVSDETVAQMGSDFDVDKMFAYLNQYTTRSNGMISPSRDGDRGFTELDQIKQEYVDMHFDVLTDRNMLPNVLQPLDIPYLSNEADKIDNLRPEGVSYDPLDPMQQVLDHDNQQAGKALIGIYSNFSVFNSMLEMYPQEMYDEVPAEGGGSEQVSRVVRLEKADGTTVELTQIGGTATVEMPNAPEGTIGDVIKMKQNAAVDNAKELVLGKLNLTKNTAGVDATLTMLNNGSVGASLEQSARFMAQPIIKLLDQEIKRLTSQLNDEFIEGETVDVAIKNIYNRVMDSFDTEFNITNGRQLMEDGVIAATIPSKESLLENIERSADEVFTNETFANKQLNILAAYKELHQISRGVDGLQTVTNFGDRKGPGKSLLHAKNKVDQLSKLGSNKVFPHGNEILGRGEGRTDTEWGSAADNSFVLAYELFKDLFEYDSNVFNDVKAELDSITEDGISQDESLAVFRNLRSFVFTHGDMFGNVEGERQNLLFGENNIARRIMDLQDRLGKTNNFLIRLRPSLPTSENDPATVSYSADKGDQLDEMKISHDFAGMLVHDDQEIRTLAEDLVKYSYLVGGGTMGPTSFHKYVPLGYLIQKGMKEQIMGSENTRGFPFDNETDISNRFLEQYLQHNPQKARTLTDEELEQIGGLRKTFPIIPSLTKEVGFNKVVPYSHVSAYNEDTGSYDLYAEFGDQYVQIDTLGNENITEYNAQEDKTFNASILPENRSQAITQNENRGEPKEVNQALDSPRDIVRNRSSIGGDQFIDSVLDNVDDPYTIEMMKFVQEIDTDFNVVMWASQKIKNKYGSETEGVYHGAQNPNDIILNKSLATERDSNYIARTLLHEWVHKQTVYLNENRNNLTDKQDSLLRKMNRLMQMATRSGKLPKKVLSNMAKRDAEGNIMRDNNGNVKYEWAEFIAYGFATESVQEQLATIEADNKTLLDQIIESIRDLILTLADSIGLDVDQNSALAHTIESTINLIEENKRVKREGNNPQNKTENYKGKTLSIPKDPFSESNETTTYAIKETETDGNNNVVVYFENGSKLFGKMVDKSNITISMIKTSTGRMLDYDSAYTAIIKEKTTSEQDTRSEREKAMDMLRNRGEANMQHSLGKTVGEVRSQLTDRQKEIFDSIRSRIQTKCN